MERLDDGDGVEEGEEEEDALLLEYVPVSTVVRMPSRLRNPSCAASSQRIKKKKMCVRLLHTIRLSRLPSPPPISESTESDNDGELDDDLEELDAYDDEEDDDTPSDQQGDHSAAFPASGLGESDFYAIVTFCCWVRLVVSTDLFWATWSLQRWQSSSPYSPRW